MIAKTCPRCGTTYEEGGRFCPKDGAALRPSAAAGLSPGILVAGRYEIRREVGRGGMSVVYLAEDIRLHRPCALKVLQAGSLPPDAEATARFYRAATSASRISHPHVVAIYNFDETEDGLVYLATEFVDGQSLQDKLDALSILSPRPTARIVWQVANALEAAHALKIAHRDLKPGNIMLTRYGHWEDFVKVVDFGIAKAFGTQSGSTITTTGHWVGTPAYMSPEQWAGADVDHRSDLYSLGLMAVRMLAGGLPIDRGPPGGPADSLLAALPPNDWPDELTGVLGRCLSPVPDDRFQSARAFSSAFVRAIDSWIPPEPGRREPWEARIELSPVSAVRADSDASSATPAARPSRPSSPRLLVTSVLLAAVLGIIGLAYLGGSTDPAPGPVAAEPNDSGSPATALSDGDTPEDTVPPDTASDLEIPAVPVGEPTSAEEEPPPPSDVSLERLRALIDLADPDPDSMRAAVGLAETLRAGSLPPGDRLEVAYREAEAHLYLGNPGEGCRILRRIAPDADLSAVYARAVRALLESNCGAAGPRREQPSSTFSVPADG